MPVPSTTICRKHGVLTKQGVQRVVLRLGQGIRIQEAERNIIFIFVQGFEFLRLRHAVAGGVRGIVKIFDGEKALKSGTIVKPRNAEILRRVVNGVLFEKGVYGVVMHRIIGKRAEIDVVFAAVVKPLPPFFPALAVRPEKIRFVELGNVLLLGGGERAIQRRALC